MKQRRQRIETRKPGAAAKQPSSEVASMEKLARLAAEQDNLDEAIATAHLIIAIEPTHAEAHNFLGTLFMRKTRYRDAFHAYSRALELDNQSFRAFSNISVVMDRLGHADAAVLNAMAAIDIDPDYINGVMNLADIYRSQHRYADAAEVYERYLQRHPDSAPALTELHFVLTLLCDWPRLAAVRARIRQKGYALHDPRQIWMLATSPTVHLAAARLWAGRFSLPPKTSLPARPRSPAARSRPLRIGYISSDFRYHATSRLVVELFELHDRARFESFGYCTGQEDGSAMRRRVIGALDHFAVLEGLSDAQAARKIHGDGIDILIDLMGFTKSARTGILAHRPAPIQVNFLGFPGSMGADFMDYVIADAIIAPPGADTAYDEKIVRLPNCYQPNDRKRAIHPDRPSRRDCGLPDEGFVFCSFNSSYKTTEEMFDLWMRLLQAVPGSVLWLLQEHATTGGNLRREAERRGIAAERLVFAPPAENSLHLARLGHADLFLDTLPVNAHTTASDALWAGLPVLTCVGEAFVSRVASSLLHAVGLPELSTGSLSEFEEKALFYARYPDALRGLRDRLERNRVSAALFDTPRFTRNFEQALVDMAALRDAGLPAAAISVREPAAPLPS